jgi:phosphohistidine phosphatase
VRTLVLLRHLKSAWDDPGLADHDRPLAPRGRRAGERVRRHIEEAGISADLVLCSSAVRAVETWEAVRGGVPEDVAVEVEDGLYLASAEALLARLNDVPDAIASVLLIAHNPGTGDLATGLAGSGDGDVIERMSEKYPTGGLATLVFEGPWATLAWGDAELAEFVVPREL